MVFCLILFFKIIHKPMDGLYQFAGCKQNLNIAFIKNILRANDKTMMFAQHNMNSAHSTKDFDSSTTVSSFHMYGLAWRRTRIEIYISLYPKDKLGHFYKALSVINDTLSD